MQNRFLEMDQYLKRCHPGPKIPRTPRGTSSSLSLYAQPFAAQDRALVILIENGGVDLGIPTLVEKVLSAIPGASAIQDSHKKKLVEQVRDKIKNLTDWLLETAELSVNRYSAAAPGLFGEVALLRDGTSSYNDLKGKLITLSRAEKIIDLLILTHGRDDYISVTGGIDSERIRKMKDEHGKLLSIRSVYMMNCVGSSLNQAWLDAGAKVSSGTIRNNYLPEPTTYFFWQNWKGGLTFENAVTSAYRRAVKLMNDAVRGFIREIPLPGAGALADLVDFEKFDFVTDSAPVIQGQRTVTINTDDLKFTQSLSGGLASTVLPVGVLESMVAASARPGVAEHSYSFNSPPQLANILAGMCDSPALSQVKDLLDHAAKITKRAQTVTAFANSADALGAAGEKLAIAANKLNGLTQTSDTMIGNATAACEIGEAISVLNNWSSPNSTVTSQDAAKAFDKLFGGVAQYFEKLPPPVNSYAKVLKEISRVSFFRNMQELMDPTSPTTPRGRQMKEILDSMDSNRP